MPYDLSSFNLGDMLKCSPRLRETSMNAPTLEASAQRVCRFLYDELRNSAGDRQCAMVRCYKTHQFGSLKPDLQNFATRVMNGEQPERIDAKRLGVCQVESRHASCWQSCSQGAKRPPLTWLRPKLWRR